MEKLLHTVKDATFTKYGKWRVEIEIHGEPMRVCWLTPTQYGFLESAFSHTTNGYSDKRVQVTAEFDDNGHYIRCSARKSAPRASRHVTPLITGQETVDAGLLDQD